MVTACEIPTTTNCTALSSRRDDTRIPGSAWCSRADTRLAHPAIASKILRAATVSPRKGHEVELRGHGIAIERFSCSKVTTISNRDELERFAVAAVGAFLAGYGSTNQSAAPSKRTTGRKTSDGTKQNLVIRRSVKSPD
jgi:hypothetical protein